MSQSPTQTPSELVPVLVVDDERDIRDGVERFLGRMGCRVVQASDALTGLELLESEAPWVVLLDLKMPGMDGMDALPVILRRRPEAMVIVITGFATVETAIQAMKNGAYDFIPKPFNPDQLRITVGRAIERRRLRDEAQRLAQERARTLADLDTEKSRTRTIIRALPFGVVVTSTSGQVVLMNPAFRHMVGLEPEAKVGQALTSYIDDQGLADMVARLTAEQRQAGGEHSHELTTPGGRHLLARGTRVDGEDGECLGAVVVMVDLTPFKLLESVRNEFVAKVSHELRSPLSTIYLQLSLLLGDGQEAGDAESRHLISRAREKTEGLISFVRDLLDLSRLEAGPVGREPVEVDLARLLGEAVEGVRPQAQDKGQTLELAVNGVPAHLVSDPAGLESVFTNLVTNACKYTPQGGAIKVRAFARGGRAVVEVADNGIGIEPDKQDKVFEKFYRIKNEHTRYVTGTGLGLPIVKSVLDSLGGEISLASAPGQGSTFTVTLPAGGGAEPAGQAEAKAED